jgi:alkanesulfonate monooxygenase SsuD/methylene tetrahydromethanopterin reductase-like flavin-dependent oxidoreductase (luciferase family)
VRFDDAAVRPAPERVPPIWLGGKGGPRLLGLAARRADGWNTVWRIAPDAYAAKVEDVRRACERAGRDHATFRRSVGLYSLIGEDADAVRTAFERGRAAAPGDLMTGDDLDSWRADTLSGTPTEVLERVAAFEDLGVEELIVAPWVLPFAIHDPGQVELFAEQVITPLRRR